MSKQELEAQLSALEASSRTAKGSDLFEPLPKNWKPPVRLQPENTPESDSTQFRVGDRDSRFNERQALPKFSWPEPGAPISKELAAVELKYSVVREIAGSHLRDSIRYTAEYDLLGHVSGFSHYAETRSEKWGFLLGLWASHQMEPPSETQMKIWAEELIAEWKAKSASLSEVRGD